MFARFCNQYNANVYNATMSAQARAPCLTTEKAAFISISPLSLPLPIMSTTSTEQSAEEIISVSVDKIAEVWNPFTDIIWSEDLERPITEEEVRSAIESKSLLSPSDAKTTSMEARANHASRIAWFVAHIDSDEARVPIGIDFGIPGYPQTHFEIWDGNHRFAAHLYCKKPAIRATWSGASSEAARFTHV